MEELQKKGETALIFAVGWRWVKARGEGREWERKSEGLLGWPHKLLHPSSPPTFAEPAAD